MEDWILAKGGTGGSLADNNRLATVRGRRGSKSVRCHNVERKGRRLQDCECHDKDLTDQITYDTSQLPHDTLATLRDQILALLKAYASGPRPIRVQLCVCLAILAIQMLEWNGVIASVVNALGNDTASHACILEFLKVLPEEVTEGRKINLTEEELTTRTQELLGDNAVQVVQLFIGYAQSSRMFS